MKLRSAKEPTREYFMVMIPLHKLLKDATKEIREAVLRILTTNLLKVRSLGEKCTISGLTLSDQPNTFTIAVFNR